VLFLQKNIYLPEFVISHQDTLQRTAPMVVLRECFNAGHHPQNIVPVNHRLTHNTPKARHDQFTELPAWLPCSNNQFPQAILRIDATTLTMNFLSSSFFMCSHPI
jgi:hypothetical protein